MRTRKTSIISKSDFPSGFDKLPCQHDVTDRQHDVTDRQHDVSFLVFYIRSTGPYNLYGA